MRSERKTHEKSERKRDKAARRRPKYWVTVGAMGALVAYGAFDSKVLVSAHAAGLDGTAPVATQQRAQGPTHRFDIEAGALGDVLDAFKDVTGWEVVLKSEDIRTIASPGVSGAFSDE